MQEELFKYLVGVVGKPVAALELPLLEQSLLQLEIAVAIVEGSLEGTAEHFVGLRYL